MAQTFTFEELQDGPTPKTFTFEEVSPRTFTFEELSDATASNAAPLAVATAPPRAGVAEMAAATRATVGVIGQAIAATDLALEHRPQDLLAPPTEDAQGRPLDPRGRNPSDALPAQAGNVLGPQTYGTDLSPLMAPLIPLRKAFSQGEQLTYLAGLQPEGAAKTALHAAGDVTTSAEDLAGGVMEFMTSPVGIATLGLGSAPGALRAVVSGAFTADMINHAASDYTAFKAAKAAGDNVGQAEAISSALRNLGMAGLAGSHVYAEARNAITGPKVVAPPDPKLEALKQVAPLTAEAAAKAVPVYGDTLNVPKGEQPPSAQVRALLEEGVTRPDAEALVAGTKTVKEVVEGAFSKHITPAWNASVSQVNGGHGEAWVAGYNNAIERLTSIVTKPEAISTIPLTTEAVATVVEPARPESEQSPTTEHAATFRKRGDSESLSDYVKAKREASGEALPPYEQSIEELRRITAENRDAMDKAKEEKNEAAYVRLKAAVNKGEQWIKYQLANPRPRPEAEQSRTGPRFDPFEEAARGDEAAYDHLDEQFRKTYPEPDELESRGRPSPHQVHTPEAFVRMFDTAFGARDFESVLQAIKATSDVNIWKPMLKDLFKKQGADPIAAQKAEWFRHVFAGTVPADAIPKAPRPTATPPPPSPGPPPPPPQPPPGGTPPPYTPPPRIPVDPIAEGTAKSPYKIIEDFSTAIGKAIRVLKLKSNQLGVYRPGDTMTAERFAGDLDTAAHELAGHWTDDVHGIGKPWIAPRTRSPYDSELAQFWVHGSVTPSSSLRYRRAEGIAEFIRAYVVNPPAARAAAPNFTTYFESTLPRDALGAILDFSKDVRTWAGADPIRQGELMAAPEPLTLTQRLWKGIHGRGFGFEVNPVDRLREMFDDPYHYAVKAFKEASELAGKKLLPQQDFELLARLLSGHDRLMSRQFENGLEPLRPEQRLNAQGQMEVVPIIDPVTKQAMTLKWLFPFDTTSMKTFDTMRKQVSALMVHERTLEKARQLGRPANVSGMGAGLQSDVAAAKAFMARLAQDPGLAMMLKEGARRYRLWADKNLDMLVDSGRLSKEAAKDIRDRNEFYVDMHRLSEEFDVANFAQRGGKIGTARDVIKRFKGSSLQVDDVYRNLLDQTDAIQKEAHRNLTMNAFTDSLRNLRELHGPDLKDFDQFGRKVGSENRNTIRVFRNGKAEHWQFAPEIYESLKGLGEMQTNALWTLATTPSRFARYMITHGPSFIARNILRDTQERSVNSITGGKPWDILSGYTDADVARFETFGGGQFGNYMRDRLTWNREITRVAQELTKDPKNILLSPLKLKRGWEELSAKSEALGRIAEFRTAFEVGKKQLARDHPTLTPQQLDYNAALWAAGQARGLLDFAKAGTVMRHVNQAIPFSNAAMRGLVKSFTGLKENPGRYAMNWGLYVLTPTLAVMMWNRRDEETWQEYLQLPAYRRDMFFNLKMGNYWLTVPKPHLLGVLAGGVERAIIAMTGESHAGEGYGRSLKNAALPVGDFAEATGPLRTFIELEFNRDTFRDRSIVPDWEKDLKPDLRKSAIHASGAGQWVAGALNATGLEIDPRQVDHVLKSLGGAGNIVADATRKDATATDVAIKATGLLAEASSATPRDVQWVFDWAKRNGKLNDSQVELMRDYREAVFEAKDKEEQTKASTRLRKFATQLRQSTEKITQ